MATCRDCREIVLWLRMADTGRPIPVNPDRVLGGNIILDGDLVRVVKPDRGQLRHVTHYATCVVQKEQREARAKAKRDAKKVAKSRQLGLFDAPATTKG